MDSYLIETPWETRNLGLPSYTLKTSIFDEENCDKHLQNALNDEKDKGDFFVSLRLTQETTNYGKILEKNGFYFTECLMTAFTHIENNKIYKDFISNKSNYVPASFDINKIEIVLSDVVGNDYDVIKEIAMNSFINDRFSLDEYCTKEVADKRFSFWIDDLKKDVRNKFYLFKYDSKNIAFLVLHDDVIILIGFLKEYSGKGLGSFLYLSVMEKHYEIGNTYIETWISCNNLPVVNLCSKLDYRFKDIQPTYHYWSKHCKTKTDN